MPPTPLDLKLVSCKEKLINLTRQNNLLFYKKRKSSSLIVKSEAMQSLYDDLLNENKFKFWEIPEESTEEQESEIEGKEPGLFEQKQEVESSSNEDWLISNPPEDDEIVCDFSSNSELRKILKNIYRRAKTEFEERGLNIAYIFFGLLEWSEQKNSECIKSPLILVPIQIEHKSVTKSYQIVIGDEEVILNPALKVKFKRDFNITLPEIETNVEELDLEKYFSLIESHLSALNVNVSRDIHIGLFSFHKMIMYSDYEKNHELMKEHFLISCFGGGRKVDEINCLGSDRVENLDDIKDIKKQFHILDADSSQQRCIEMASNGASFVMVGPPGTGKSQTIANIVAKFIEDGKTVLFVSDKMAALEVVFKRLKDCDLSDFCLELHSHKANKKQVVTELGKSLAERIVPQETIDEMEYNQFLRLRDKLNDYLLAIHTQREPLGMSVYEALGSLADLEQMLYIPKGLSTKSQAIKFTVKDNNIIVVCPRCSQNLRLPKTIENQIIVTCTKCKKEFPFDPKGTYKNVRDINKEALMEFNDVFDRLESLWDVFIKGDEFPWYGFKASNYTPTLKYQIEELLRGAIEKSTDLNNQNIHFQNILGLPSIACLKDFRIRGEVLHLLSQDNYVPISWTEHFDYKNISVTVKNTKELCHRFFLANDYISRYNQGFFTLSDEYLKDLINALRALQIKLGVQDYQVAELVQDLPTIKESLRLLEEVLRRISSSQEVLWQQIDIPAIKNVKNLEIVCKAIILLFDEDKRPELSWFNDAAEQELNLRIKSLEEQIQNIKNIENDLLFRYKPEIFSLEVERLIHLFENNAFYRTYILKYFLPQYHQDVQKIKACCLKANKIVPSEFYNDLLKIQKILNIRKSIEEQVESDKRIFGRFYSGEKTQFENVRRGIETLNSIKSLIRKVGLTENSDLISRIHDVDILQRCVTVAEDISNQDKRIFEFLLNKGIPIADIKTLAIADVLSTLSQSIASIISLLAVLPSFQKCLISDSKFPSVQEIEESRRNLCEWRGVKEELSSKERELTVLLGQFYNGFNTDWAVVEKILSWYQEFTLLLPSLPTDGKLKSLLITGRSQEINNEMVNSFKKLVEEVVLDYKLLWDEFNSVVLNHKELSWEEGDFSLVIQKVIQLREHLDGLKLWSDWQALKEVIEKSELQDFLQSIYKSREDVFPEQVRSIFRKAILSEWLDTIYEGVRILKDFRGEDHTKVREKFIELDVKLSRLSRALVIQSANERKPLMLNGSIGGSQVGILRREMSKQKRHKPIKKLFSEIFDLVIKLKRCFFMSPMSVSQYLEPRNFKFDLVIFDEASQICVEDAFPAILRGSQVIIVGDNKQLPPTSFFKSEEQYEFDEDEDMEDIENLESILDECRGLGLKEQMLKWHYRSRHEDLINYSNYKFYGRQLITFPASMFDVEHLGVKFDYVENGIYDRGGRRNNLLEAQRVAELVFEHFKKYPDKSLGVATLSMAQMEAVQDAIELKLKENSEYSKFFTESRLEGFFVKNLENVQGDERDVIIFSVGYGKDSTGRLSMNFGPLNKSGGERRLNVLITRAREKNIVVTSIKSADFLSNITAEGVIHLRNYLAFADNGGIEAIEGFKSQSEDFDSPLEESVASAIRQLGYEVVSQVGCAGYKIDLGIIDPVNSQKYILAVECDGATYHSSYSARDRDRLRQSVLENMGWTVYRIWSPDWVHKRNVEINKLKYAIETSRYKRPVAFQSKQEAIGASIKIDVVENLQDNESNVTFGKEYDIADVGRFYKSEDFYSSNSEHLIYAQIEEIIRQESPIHTEVLFRRIMSCYQLGRMGDRIQKRLYDILSTVVNQNDDFHFKKDFVYTDNSIIARYPNPNHQETLREIEHIYHEEIKEVMLNVIRLHSGVTKDCLFTETLKFFGFQRQTDANVSVLKNCLKKLLTDGKLQSKEDFLVIN